MLRKGYLIIFTVFFSPSRVLHPDYVFHDLARIKPSERVAKSPIIQFYYGGGNAGDCFAVLGIQKALGVPVDTWSVNDAKVDFNFINKNYKCAIFGGGGLFHTAFSSFLTKLSSDCTVPMVMWGVGSCLPEAKSGHKKFKNGVNKTLVQALVKKAELVNVRDQLTASTYELQNVSIAPCPAMFYAQGFAVDTVNKPGFILYASHENHKLVPQQDKEQIRALLDACNVPYKTVDHVAHGDAMTRQYIDDIFKNYYAKCGLVVTTRFHGAVIAYAMGIPYIALPYDKKLIAFNKEHGNGLVVRDIDDLKSKLTRVLNGSLEIKLRPVNLNPILTFNQKAIDWIKKKLS